MLVLMLTDQGKTSSLRASPEKGYCNFLIRVEQVVLRAIVCRDSSTMSKMMREEEGKVEKEEEMLQLNIVSLLNKA
jgi:hypothetical protein